MNAEMALRDEGMKILISNLGRVEAERFISLIIREPFDYTEWQKNKPNNPTNVINLKFRCMSWKVTTVKKGIAEQSEAAAC